MWVISKIEDGEKIMVGAVSEAEGPDKAIDAIQMDVIMRKMTPEILGHASACENCQKRIKQTLDRERRRYICELLAGIALLLAVVSPARAADPVPFFRSDSSPPPVYGPELPDPKATECVVGDATCLQEHDERALALAVDTHDAGWCAEAVDEARCRALFEFVDEGAPPAPPNPALSDPCTYVVRIHDGEATLYTPARRTLKVPAAPTWKPAAFLGACNLDRLSPLDHTGSIQTLPSFPWES